MVAFRDLDSTTGGYYKGVLPGRIQEAICKLHLFEQYEMRVS